MKTIISVMLIVSLFMGCVQQKEKESGDLPGVQALLWSQYSAEAQALYLQAYNVATSALIGYKNTADGLPAAVTLDIDETVLDNSPFNVHLLREGYEYSEDYWAEWCERREALPLPGALAFTKLADSLNIAVYYVSNRKVNLLDATIDNLQKFGFPNADSSHVLLKTNTSSKDERREQIRENYEIILLLGDNLGDFDGLFDDRSTDFGKSEVKNYSEEFGRRFIVFPNPIYGSWVRPIFPEGLPESAEVLKVLRGYGEVIE